jgi:hypothetical protein
MHMCRRMIQGRDKEPVVVFLKTVGIREKSKD